MSFTLPEILQLEMLRDSSLVSLLNPDGKVVKLLWDRSRFVRFGKPERLTKFVNLLFERLSTWIDENEPFPEVGSNPWLWMLPPSLLLDKLTRTKLELDQKKPGTDPFSEFPERSRVCNFDMLLRNFHEIVPLKFVEESFISVIWDFEQLKFFVSWNQEGLNPVTDLKAFETSSWSVLLHEDSTSATSKKTIKNLQKIFISCFKGFKFSDLLLCFFSILWKREWMKRCLYILVLWDSFDIMVIVRLVRLVNWMALNLTEEKSLTCGCWLWTSILHDS